MGQPTIHRFQAEVSRVLQLVINSLYSHKEVFLRELVSNASDALDKLRFRSISEPELASDAGKPTIRLIPNEAEGTLTIWDNGVGMTEAELTQNLGTVAWSGSQKFLEQLAESKKGDALGLIGQFGVGFYSAYLVADQVEVVSRAAGEERAHKWRSSGKDEFSIELAEREGHGTSVVLHLKADQREFLQPWRLRELIKRYSDYIEHPIELATEKDGQTTFETINRGSALWQRPASEISQEQYDEFYKHLSHDWEPPLGHKHFRIEGTQMFVGLLFVPRRAPLDLLEGQPKHGVRLHVRRVFVMENCEELVPRWLRFVRGVVDSEDLPLNVSREILQDSRAVRIIKKQVVNHTLDLLEQIAQRPDDYAQFWKAFGPVLKEGLHFEPEYKDRLAELVRFESTQSDGTTSLADYVSRMPEAQPAIYYAEGASKQTLQVAPQLERLKQRGWEVLLLTDPVDPFAVEGLKEYRGKRLVSAMHAELPLEPDAPRPEASQAARSLVEHIKKLLEDRVSDVRESTRLTESPVCLVAQEGALPPHVERMLRLQNMDVPAQKRTLEVNLEHPVLERLAAIHAAEGDSPQVKEYVELLYDQALLAEGSPIADPASFARRVATLMAVAMDRPKPAP